MRDTLMLLEAIRLEIRAAAETVANAAADVPDTMGDVLRKRANALSRLGFSNTNLANDEREALGYDVEPAA